MPSGDVLRTLRALAGVLALLAGACASQREGPARYQGSYPEGPLWREGALYYAEMGADRISVVREGRRSDFFRRPGCGPTALAPYGEGFLILCHIEGVIVAVDEAARVRFVKDRDDAGNAFRDPNDCHADGRGGVYFSDPGLFSRQTRAHGALVHIDAAGRVRRIAEALWYPNGVFVDVGRRQLYLSETFRRRVLRYDLGEDGGAGPPAIFFDLAAAPPQTRYARASREAGPDGLEMAPNGELFVAIYGEGRVLRVDRDGRYRGALETAMQYVTNIAFRPDGAAWITGAFENETPPFPGEVRLYESLAGPARAP